MFQVDFYHTIKYSMNILKYFFCCCRRRQEIDFDIDANIDWTDYNIKYQPPKDEAYYNSFRTAQNYQM